MNSLRSRFCLLYLRRKEKTETEQKGIDLRRVVVTHREGETTSLSNLREMEPDGYDNVLILGSDRVETQEESDARTVVGTSRTEKCAGWERT